MRRSAVLAVLLASTWTPIPLVAQPGPVDALRVDLASAERGAADTLRTLDDRARAADAAIEIRRRLLGAADPEDPRRITWLVDQGAAVLARLGRDAADTAVLFAVPSAAQRARAAEAATEAARLLDSARQAAAAVTEQRTRLSLREEGGGAGELLLTALRDEQVRGQFVRGRAALLLAALAPDPAEQHVKAQTAIESLSGVAFEDAAAEASRRVSLGAALMFRDEPGDAVAAGPLFDWVTGTGSSGRPGVLPATAAEALMGRVHAADAAGFDAAVRHVALARTEPPRTVRGEPDPLWHLLFADAVASAYVRRWRADGDPRRLAAAFAVYDGLDVPPGSAGLPPEELRSVVLVRMDALTRWRGDIAFGALPPRAAFAHAVALARTPGGRAEAMGHFEELAGRADAGPVRADALWELSVLAGEGGDGPDAVELAVRFAREHAGDARADQAIAYAVYHARVRAAIPGAPESARRVYADALRIGTSSFTHLPAIDRWRIDRASLLLEPSPEHDRAAGLALLEAVPAASPRAEEAAAIYERTQGGFLDAARTRMESASRRGETAEAGRLAAQVSAEAGRAIEWARAHARPSLVRFRMDAADALVELGDAAAAVELYRDALDRGVPVPGGAVRARLGLGRALIAAGDDAGAFAVLRDLVAPFDAQAASAARPQEYWFAWTLMLEVLARADAGGRADAVQVQAQRLSGVDPEFGGEPWRGRIRRVLDGLRRGGKP